MFKLFTRSNAIVLFYRKQHCESPLMHIFKGKGSFRCYYKLYNLPSTVSAVFYSTDKTTLLLTAGLPDLEGSERNLRVYTSIGL